MKKLFLFFSAGALLILTSCNSEKKADEPKDNSAAEKNLAAVHGVNMAVETGDVSKLGDYIAADAIDHSGEKGEVKGLDSIKAELAVIHTMADNMKSETIKEFADSVNVIQWMRYTGTSKMPMGGMPAGTNYDMMTVHVSKFNKDGKATDHWEFMLPSDMMKMMPPPPPPTMKK